MAPSRAAALLRKPEQPQRTAFLELFFDLVFIFALTRVSHRLVENITAERWAVLTGAGQTLILLLAVWTVWLATALITDLYDPEQPRIQLLIVATMFASLVMAIAVPLAFGSRGLAFAGAYVAIHLGRGLLLVRALRGHREQRRAARVLFWFSVSAVPWIAGALASDTFTRAILWTAATLIDHGAQLLRPPVPGLGRPSLAEIPIAAEHLSERYQQFFIIALGELILITGITLSGGPITNGGAAAFTVSFAATVILWRIYNYQAGQLLPAAIRTAHQPSRVALWLAASHLLMVIGIVAIAAGFEVTITHPFGHTYAAWAAVILGGPALFLVGRGILGYAVFGQVFWSWWIGVLVLAVAAPALLHTDSLAVAAATTLVLLGLAIYDTVHSRKHPRRLAPTDQPANRSHPDRRLPRPSPGRAP